MHKSELETRFTLRNALTVFKHTVRTVVNFCLNREDAIFFGSSRSPICRLESVWITNFVPCINGVVYIDISLREQLLMGLVALNTRATKDLRRKLRDFSLTVVPSRLSQRGAPAWRIRSRRDLPAES